jgi:SlyX protein
VAVLAVSPSDNERLEQLELKLAYLERGNQELGDVVYRQQQALDALMARLERLTDLVQSIAARPRDYSAEDEKPPHY